MGMGVWGREHVRGRGHGVWKGRGGHYGMERERERENVTTRRGFTEAMGAPRKHETHIIVGGGRPCAPRGGRPCTSIHRCSADIRLRATGVGRRPSFTSQLCDGVWWCAVGGKGRVVSDACVV